MKHRDTPTTHAAADAVPAEVDRRTFLENARRDIRAYSQSANYLIDDVRDGAADDSSTDALVAQRLVERRDAKFKRIVDAWHILPNDMREDVASWAYGRPTRHQDKRTDARPVATRSLVTALFAAMYESKPRHMLEHVDSADVDQRMFMLLALRSRPTARLEAHERTVAALWVDVDPAVIGVISTDRYWRKPDVFDVASHLDQIDDALQLRILTSITKPSNDQTSKVLGNAPLLIKLAHRVPELEEANQEALFGALRPHDDLGDTEVARNIYDAVFAHTSPYRHAATAADAKLSHRLYGVADRSWWLLNAGADDFAGLTNTLTWYQLGALGRELVTCSHDPIDPDQAALHVGKLAGNNIKMLELAERCDSTELLHLVMPHISASVIAEHQPFAASLAEVATYELAMLIMNNQDPFSRTYGSQVPRNSYRLIGQLGEIYLDTADPTDDVRSARSVITGFAALQDAIHHHQAELTALGRTALLTDD